MGETTSIGGSGRYRPHGEDVAAKVIDGEAVIINLVAAVPALWLDAGDSPDDAAALVARALGAALDMRAPAHPTGH